MTPNQESEIRKQALAESLQRQNGPASLDADVEAYRQVMQAAARPLNLQLADDFASQVATRVSEAAEEASGFERVIGSLAVIVLIVAASLLIRDSLRDALHQVSASLTSIGVVALPWPMLGAAALSLLAVAVSDRWLIRR